MHAGASAGGRSQIPIFGAHIIRTRDYSRVPDRYMAVGSSDSSYPGVAKAGGWRTSLPATCVDKIESTWGELMTTLGYGLASNKQATM